MATQAPDAATKLRLVLDYLPCESCLAQPVKDQDLLCSICHRLDRQVAVRVATKTQVILERPEPEPEVIIPPAKAEEPLPDEEAPVAPASELRIVFRGEEEEDAPGTQVVVEPYEDDEAAALPVEVAPVAEELPVEVEPLEEERVGEPAAAPSPAQAEEPEKPKRGLRALFGRRAKPQEAPVEAHAEPEVEPEEEVSWDDVASYTEPGEDDLFGVAGGVAQQAEPEPDPVPEPEPRPAAAPVVEPEPVPDDDFVFRPPPQEEAEPAAEAAPVQPLEEEIVPTEEIPVEPEEGQPNPWAPPTEFLADEEETPAEAPAPAEELLEEVAEETQPPAEAAAPAELEEPEPAPASAPAPEDEEILETEIVEMEIVEDDESAPEPAAPEPMAAEPAPEDEEILETEIVEMEIVEDDEPQPVAPASAEAAAESGSDLYRLRGFDASHEAALAEAGITSLSHLSGHDAGELASRAGLDAEKLQPWIQVADLVHEVGVPVEASLSLVQAGVPGPQGLRDMEADDVVDRVAAFGGHPVSAREVKRWKRRA